MHTYDPKTLRNQLIQSVRQQEPFEPVEVMLSEAERLVIQAPDVAAVVVAMMMAEMSDPAMI